MSADEAMDLSCFNFQNGIKLQWICWCLFFLMKQNKSNIKWKTYQIWSMVLNFIQKFIASDCCVYFEKSNDHSSCLYQTLNKSKRPFQMRWRFLRCSSDMDRVLSEHSFEYRVSSTVDQNASQNVSQAPINRFERHSIEFENNKWFNLMPAKMWPE